MKKSTLFGMLAFGSTVAYLWLRRHEGQDELEGIEVKINPEKVIDSTLAISNLSSVTKDKIRTIAHRAIDRYNDS